MKTKITKMGSALLVAFFAVFLTVSVNGETPYYQYGESAKKYESMVSDNVLKNKNISISDKEISIELSSKIEQGESRNTVIKETVKDLIEKKVLYADAIAAGMQVSDYQYNAYIKELKESIAKAENKEQIEEFYSGYGGEAAYWKEIEPTIRQNLAIHTYIYSKIDDSLSQDEQEDKIEEIKKNAYEKGCKLIDLEKLTKMVSEVYEEQVTKCLTQ